MPHVRAQIRAKVVALLKTSMSVDGRVEASRLYNYSDGELPATSVRSNSETVEVSRVIARPRQHLRQLELQVQHHVQQASGLDDQLDALLTESEQILSGNPTLDGLASSIELQGMDIEMAAGESEQPIGVATQTWLVQYHVNETDPTTPI